MVRSNIPVDKNHLLAKQFEKRSANRISKQKSRRKLNIKVPMGKNGKLVFKEYISQKGTCRSEYFKQYRLKAKLKLMFSTGSSSSNYVNSIDDELNSSITINGLNILYNTDCSNSIDELTVNSADECLNESSINVNSIDDEVISSITINSTDEHLNKSSKDGKPGKSIISIALGNALEHDQTRYRAVVIFAHRLFKRNVIGTSDSPWILSVVMRENYFSHEYKLLLEQLNYRVIYVQHPVDKIYMYSIRY